MIVPSGDHCGRLSHSADIASLKVHDAQRLWDIGPHEVHEVAPIVRVAGMAAVSRVVGRELLIVRGGSNHHLYTS